MNPILLTAAQAQELHTTGRLTGYREKCEWQPPNGASVFEIDDWDAYWKVHYCLIADPEVELNDVQKLTPPRDTDTTYAVKEPWDDEQPDLSAGIVGGIVFAADQDQDNNDDDWQSASLMPDWAVRQHARITDIKLIISDGELWWDMDLENAWFDKDANCYVCIDCQDPALQQSKGQEDAN